MKASYFLQHLGACIAFFILCGVLPSAGLAQDSANGTSKNKPSKKEDLPEAAPTVSYGPSESRNKEDDSFLLIPPLLLQEKNNVHTTAFFPFLYLREAPDDYQLFATLYYQRRSARLNVDVAFPLFWSFRDPWNSTYIVPPVHYRGGSGFDFGLTPLFYHGREKDSHYTVIPPLLTFAWRNAKSAHTFSTLFWRIRDREDIDWGLFPLLWVKDQPLYDHVLIPPVFFRFVDRKERSALTVVPPFFHEVDTEGAAWGLAPLLFHSHGKNWHAWTVPPLFHYAGHSNGFKLLTPLFGYIKEKKSHSMYALLYMRHRGDTEFDAVAPFVFSWRDPRDYSSALVIPPLFWNFQDPGSYTTLVLPFFGTWGKRGTHTTWATLLAAQWRSHLEDAAATWIFPTLQFSHDPESRTINFHPLFYSTEATTHRHLVIAPLYWDIDDYEENYRTTIAFPFLWRFRDGPTLHQMIGPVYYNEGRKQGVPYWQFHIFPFFAYGEPRPGDHWWTVLYGLFGYRRQGQYARTQLLYLLHLPTDSPD